MSRYFSAKYAKLKPYVPGEQPQGRKFIKLNTNESPFPPSPRAVAAAAEAAKGLNLYSDPECRALNAPRWRSPEIHSATGRPRRKRPARPSAPHVSSH